MVSLERVLSSLFWRIYYWVFFVLCAMAIVQESTNMVVTFREGDKKDIFLMMPCIGVVFVALVKSSKIMRNRPIFENLIAELRAMWPVEALNQEEYDLISDIIKELNFISKGYVLCYTILYLFFILPPFVQYIRRLFGQDVPLIIIFALWYPFDEFQPVYYELVVLSHTIEVFTILSDMVCGDLLLFVFINNISMQFKRLSIRIAKMIYVPIDKQLPAEYPLAAHTKDHIKKYTSRLSSMAPDEWEEIQLTELKEIIKRHHALIRLSGVVEDMYSFALLMNFVNSSIIICFCGFCCAVLEEIGEVKYKLFLVTAIFQAWLLSWYGQKLLDSSGMVATALYESGWYNASKRIKSSILIMLIRAQKKIHITTYGFSVICLESFTTIMKTSWSYFTLLLNTYKA